MTTVRCKFVCKSITESAHWDKQKPNLKAIKFEPVTSGSEENKSFFAATPSGTLEFATVNHEAAASFVVGQEYYIDIAAV